MVRFRHLIAFGFFLFSIVTLYVATLDLTVRVYSALLFAALGGYALGILGMAITMVKAGAVGRLVIGVLIGLGTGAVAAMSILPRL